MRATLENTAVATGVVSCVTAYDANLNHGHWFASVTHVFGLSLSESRAILSESLIGLALALTCFVCLHDTRKNH